MGRAQSGRWQWRPSAGVVVSAVLLACCTLFLFLMGGAVVAERSSEPIGEARGGGGGSPEAMPRPSLPAVLGDALIQVYGQVWPNMELGWKLVLGSVIGFLGAALGSVGGVGGGGIFVPMFTLVLGFDPKSSAALSKCMIMGTACSTVYYNLRMRHPTLDLPVIDYDLALLFQPMLMLGISIGVTFNVIFPEWMVILLLFLLFLGTSIRAFFKGIDIWKKETILIKEVKWLLETSPQFTDSPRMGYRPLPGGPSSNIKIKPSADEEGPILDNFHWKDLMLLLFVWVAILVVQIVMTFSRRCSIKYWILSALQVPIAAAVTLYEAISLYSGKRTILSRGRQEIRWKFLQFWLYCVCGILAGIVGGFLGLGGGFILGPLFLELGVPPQVASATSTFAMMFSSSMSVIQYYLLDRFPIRFAGYFILLATIAAFVGQHIVRKLIILLGRTSLIIFVLVLTIFSSAIGLGVVGVERIIKQLATNDYMGFESICPH